ncbi:hypothetical protein ALC60_07505 [Trachymyrmex zeteki]|uniref:THAP-type domain-containing protein n=1 Tax=Mycetomoellerius zeteki TaxID=64791 RepID=A0A151WZP8_9HYME|nr:hypothetical protein ALC60_07505 [Trachymyrmex zeteki]
MNTGLRHLLILQEWVDVAPNVGSEFCNNSSTKGYIMKIFPRNPAIWAKNVARKDWMPTNNSYLCEVKYHVSKIKSNKITNALLILLKKIMFSSSDMVFLIVLLKYVYVNDKVSTFQI